MKCTEGAQYAVCINLARTYTSLSKLQKYQQSKWQVHVIPKSFPKIKHVVLH